MIIYWFILKTVAFLVLSLDNLDSIEYFIIYIDRAESTLYVLELYGPVFDVLIDITNIRIIVQLKKKGAKKNHIF